MLTTRLLLVALIATLGAVAPLGASSVGKRDHDRRWIGTWAAAPQPNHPAAADVFCNQTVRLVVHTSVGGSVLRIRLSNAHGDSSLVIGRAHIARRTAEAEIEPASDRVVLFRGLESVVVPARSVVVSDPVELEVGALSDLAIGLFFPERAVATTSHVLALQTSYVADEAGDSTASQRFAPAKAFQSWPFLVGVDVRASSQGAAVVVFGDSRVDGDGSTSDANKRWPDALARRLVSASGDGAELGVLNLGMIGNRPLRDSPRQANNPFGPIFGEAALSRFESDVVAQSGVEVAIVSLGINDIYFPVLPFTAASERVTARALIDGYRRLIARAHQSGIRVIGTTIAPYEGAKFPGAGLDINVYTPAGERTRREVNEWIRCGGFDAVVDFDAVLRDPVHPTHLRTEYDGGDHLHINDAGNVAQANAFPLDLLGIGLHDARAESQEERSLRNQ